MRKLRISVLIALFLVVTAVSSPAAPKGSVERMDYGPVIGGSYTFPDVDARAEKGIAIRLAGDAAVVFDTSTLMYVKVTGDGNVDLSNTDYMKKKGGDIPTLTGTALIQNASGPGVTRNNDWSDPRDADGGPLPASVGRYRGYYQHGRKVVLSYTVGHGRVLDHPRIVNTNSHAGFERCFLLTNLQKTRQIRLFDAAGAQKTMSRSSWHLYKRDNRQLGIALVGGSERTSLVGGADHPVSVKVQPGSGSVSFRVIVASFPADLQNTEAALSSLADASSDTPDLRSLTKGGPSLWNKTLTREGSLSEADAGYVKDEVPVPKENPWNALMRISGLDFFEDGTAAVCTMNGDVWLVSGLDESLNEVQWKRFATGLYEPLGLSIRNGEIFVLEQGSITHLRDLNADYEADYYRRFNGDGPLIPRAYWMSLEHDAKGQFYYHRSGHRAQGKPHQERYGSLMQVSANGQSSRIYAHGFRQTNGLGIGPNDAIQSSDQEGNWMPATRIDHVKKGGFYGYKPNAPDDYSGEGYELPIMWLPRGADHSAGAEVFVSDDRWGPLSDHWMHLSWGQARVFAEMHERVNGQLQGGAVRLPLGTFKAGVMRGSVGPHDGQLYVAGVGVPGWTSVSLKLNTFNRIRYTGEPAHLPVGLRTSKQGVKLTFSDSLDRQSASNPENYTVKRWTYKYDKSYGSDEYSLKNPGETGRDSVEVESVQVSDDGKGIILQIPDMKPVQQMMVKYKLEGADGEAVKNRVLFTIHELR